MNRNTGSPWTLHHLQHLHPGVKSFVLWFTITPARLQDMKQIGIQTQLAAFLEASLPAGTTEIVLDSTLPLSLLSPTRTILTVVTISQCWCSMSRTVPLRRWVHGGSFSRNWEMHECPLSRVHLCSLKSNVLDRPHRTLQWLCVCACACHIRVFVSVKCTMTLSPCQPECKHLSA